MVDLIPAKFYLPADYDEEKPWFHGLSKNEKALAKKKSKQNIKKARRNRLNPHTNRSTLDLLKENLDKEESNEVADNSCITYEELRNRLHRNMTQV